MYHLRALDQREHPLLTTVWETSLQHDDPLHAVRGPWQLIDWAGQVRALEADGQIVGGFGYRWDGADDRAQGRIALLPEHRSHHTAGLLLDGICHAAASDGAPGFRLFVSGLEQWIASAADEREIKPVRSIFRMVRPPDQPLPAPRTVPGLLVRPMRSVELEAVLEALNLAWSTTWGYHPITRDMLERDLGDHPERFLLGVEEQDDTHVVGTCHPILRPEETGDDGRPWGWISNVTTIPAWQGRGVARALLLESLAHLYQQGVGRIGLGVDGGNDVPVGLYRSVGFEVVVRSVIWEYPVAPA